MSSISPLALWPNQALSHPYLSSSSFTFPLPPAPSSLPSPAIRFPSLPLKDNAQLLSMTYKNPHDQPLLTQFPTSHRCRPKSCTLVKLAYSPPFPKHTTHPPPCLSSSCPSAYNALLSLFAGPSSVTTCLSLFTPISFLSQTATATVVETTALFLLGPFLPDLKRKAISIGN